MKRTQISLTPEQHRALKDISRRTGRSMSDLVRESVDRFIERNAAPASRALALIGAFEADRDDVSLRHDEYLQEP
jgi:Arc/MetJ-type ribon-helix-helix transcriptional regulator